MKLLQRRPQRHQIPRRRAPHRDAARDPRHVLHPCQPPRERFGERPIGDERLDRVEPGLDRGPVPQREAQPGPQQAPPHGRPAAPEGRQERACLRSAAQRPLDLQVRQCRGVERHEAAVGLAPGRAQVAQAPRPVGSVGRLGLQEVSQHGARGADGRIVVLQAEALYRRHAEVAQEALAGVVEPEAPLGSRRHGAAGRGAGRLHDGGWCAVGAGGVEELCGREADDRVQEPLRGRLVEGEGSRGELDRRDDRPPSARGRDRGDVVATGLVQKRLVHERPGSEDAGHCPVDEARRLGGVLDLVADRHAVAGLYHPADVRVG
jgi:hypothetical protein